MLEFFKPVEDDVDLPCPRSLDHQKPQAIGSGNWLTMVRYELALKRSAKELSMCERTCKDSGSWLNSIVLSKTDHLPKGGTMSIPSSKLELTFA